MNKKQNDKWNKGFVLWFTGLPQSGKTTLGNRIYEILMKSNIRIERLDGDTARKFLTKDLGFSKKDREENIRRVGLIVESLSQNNVGVVASFISPYKNQREEFKKRIDGFIEVFTNCPLEVCEKRDTKGMYEKARTGEIKNFTGVSDPYEAPDNPHIELNTDKLSVDKCIDKIIDYLKENNFI